MTVVIHHNPACGTSRNVLAIIEAAGETPVVIPYLDTGWTRPQLLALFAAAGLTPRDALRTTKSPAAEFGLLDPAVDDDAILDAMIQHPVLVNRPIVCSPKGVRLCRPSEAVLDLLDRLPSGPITKEDGTPLIVAKESALTDTPQIEESLLHAIDTDRLLSPTRADHAPRILLLYGSLRERSFSRLMTEEAARILTRLGAETRTFNPSGLPLPDDTGADHPKVQELRDLVSWSEGMVWCSPERHGAMTGIMKTQIDWIPLSLGGVRPTQGKTLAVMQVNGGSQSFNTVSQLRILGRWMRLLTIPNQSSTPKAFLEFDEAGRMKPSPFYDRVVDVMEELIKFTLLIREKQDYLLDRYSERKESAAELSARVAKRS
jgi:arsenic resistance protein ArsH